jgi:hypothetical protein
MSRDAATVRADVPKISNSKDTATVSAIAETTSACSRSNSRDPKTAGTVGKQITPKTSASAGLTVAAE